MRVKAPSFWYEPAGFKAGALIALSYIYRLGHGLRHALAKPYKASMPVICVGNIVTGGSGKTPAALAVMHAVRDSVLATKPCFLTRGYGGSHKGPVEVDEERHTASDVGDEPLLLAREAPAIVSRDRKAGARYAEGRQFDLIVMDDGMQNPDLHKNIVFMVIDGATGFGNGRLLPAGPLREPVATGLEKADAFILIGDDTHGVRSQFPPGKPVFGARLEIVDTWIADRDCAYIAFCGIAHPEKFRRTLENAGIRVAAFHSFPDHYPFSSSDLEKLTDEAVAKKARLVTTAKDATRLPADFTRHYVVDILPVRLTWDDKGGMTEFLRLRLPGR